MEEPSADTHACPGYTCERPECVRRQRDELRDRCEKLREALQELHNRLSRRDVFVATCEGVTYKGWLLNIVNAALAEKEGE